MPETVWFPAAELLRAADAGRVAASAARAAGRDAATDEQFPADLADLCGAASAVLVGGPPDFARGAAWGRPLDVPGPGLLGDALDRDAAAFLPGGAASSGRSSTGTRAGGTLVLPTGGGSTGADAVAPLVVLHGRGLGREDVPAAFAAARTLAAVGRVARRRDAAAAQRDALRRLHDAVAALPRVADVPTLLDRLARAACDLLDCERATIFIHDPARGELVGRPALGVEGGVLRVRDDAGVVGAVMRSGEPVTQNDAPGDPRVARDVDAATGYDTRSLLAVPMRHAAPGGADGGTVGVFEVLNSNEPAGFTPPDVDLLSRLARHAASALAGAEDRAALVRSRDVLAERVTAELSGPDAGGHIRLIGTSAAIAAVRDTVAKLANTDLPVLILGESGTGKEVVAQSLHDRGPRADKPFVAVNCAALAETLLESELFGHEAGAFTDARTARPGKFELADGGTLFLDEIGDMSPAGQAKLLRVLEQRVVTRVGGSRAIPVDVRVVAATNADLPAKVREKKFREDLYYRLGVVTQQLPPLRDRREDILPLAEHFLKQFSTRSGRVTPEIEPAARARLEAHDWHGNVRELRNLMERIALLGDGGPVGVGDLTFLLPPGKDPATAGPDLTAGLTEATKEFQSDFIARAIDRVGGNMSEAARLLGLHRSNLYRKMRQLEMEVE